MLQDYYNNCNNVFKNNFEKFKTHLTESPYSYLNENMTYNLEKIYDTIKNKFKSHLEKTQLENLIFLPQDLITAILISRSKKLYIQNKDKIIFVMYLRTMKHIIDPGDENKLWYKYLFDFEYNSETYWKYLIKDNRTTNYTTTIYTQIGRLILKNKKLFAGTLTGTNTIDSNITDGVVKTKLSKVIGNSGIGAYANNHSLLKDIIKKQEGNGLVENIKNILNSIDNGYPILYQVNTSLSKNNKSILLLIFSIITYKFNQTQNQIIDYGEIYRIYFRKKHSIFELKKERNSTTELTTYLEKFKKTLSEDIKNFCNEEGNFEHFINHISQNAQGKQRIVTGAQESVDGLSNVYGGKKELKPPEGNPLTHLKPITNLPPVKGNLPPVKTNEKQN